MEGRLQHLAPALPDRLEHAGRVCDNLSTPSGSGAPPDEKLCADARHHCLSGQDQRRERTQSWIRLGSNVKLFWALRKTLVYDKRSMETNYVSDGRIFATWSREPYASKIGRSPILSPLYGILRELRRRYQRMRSARPLPCSSRRNAPTTSNLADMTPSNVDVL